MPKFKANKRDKHMIKYSETFSSSRLHNVSILSQMYNYECIIFSRSAILTKLHHFTAKRFIYILYEVYFYWRYFLRSLLLLEIFYMKFIFIRFTLNNFLIYLLIIFSFVWFSWKWKCGRVNDKNLRR